MIIALLILCLGLYVAFAYVMPWTNRFFSFVWTDASITARTEHIARTNELHLIPGMTDEAATQIAATEEHRTSDQFLQELGAMDPADLTSLLSGRKGLMNIVNRKMRQALTKNHGKR